MLMSSLVPVSMLLSPLVLADDLPRCSDDAVVQTVEHNLAKEGGNGEFFYDDPALDAKFKNWQRLADRGIGEALAQVGGKFMAEHLHAGTHWVVTLSNISEINSFTESRACQASYKTVYGQKTVTYGIGRTEEHGKNNGYYIRIQGGN